MIPALNESEPITEFPWFTTIYADLHAHFMSLALVFLGGGLGAGGGVLQSLAGCVALAGGGSFVFRRGGDRGAAPDQYLGPADLSGAGVVAVIYAVLRYGGGSAGKLTRLMRTGSGNRWGVALAALTFFLYQPFCPVVRAAVQRNEALEGHPYPASLHIS